MKTWILVLKLIFSPILLPYTFFEHKWKIRHSWNPKYKSAMLMIFLLLITLSISGQTGHRPSWRNIKKSANKGLSTYSFDLGKRLAKTKQTIHYKKMIAETRKTRLPI